ncbi:sodium:solute symporter family protein [Shewanella algae]|uniref:sodium:solute symporter family protein n=1 Tax=Shewanella algae TaxID=38313 RepID=UPI000C33CCFB|nr:sodium:solute symporter family protein [Shewanella algae]MBO2640513.1 sodium:solute symporter family protein [Shewanella algae]MBO2669966.1 sodium:solute symporter family protein [Shewanella algae]
MHPLDYGIFLAYLVGLLGFGYFHFKRHSDGDDYYLGGRNIKARHVGFSIAATDVGGGFSIGLAGLGFSMGLAGSWLLFTGLLGAWLSAVFVIPRVKRLEQGERFYTYPDLLKHRFGARVAMLAALISCIGYLGFTGAQILAGAKLAAATLLPKGFDALPPLQLALWAIGGTTILYTVFGGLKAVIYTDSVQWLILLLGLIGFTLPYALVEVGGWQGLSRNLPPSHMSLTAIDPITAINWLLTITPVWLIAMTLYQRMFACKDSATAKRAWYLAGVLEYPLMAISGVLLGMCARVMLPHMDSEMAVPAMIRDLLPMGFTGLIIAAYFSAIMSTADSCLMAASGNLTQDLLGLDPRGNNTLRLSMIATLLLGLVAIYLASQARQVLDAILYAYAFMVSGLFVPTLAALFWPRVSSTAALCAMLGGGLTALALLTELLKLPDGLAKLGLDPSIYGILVSAGLLVLVNIIHQPAPKPRLTSHQDSSHS